MDADALRRLADRTGFDVSALEKDYALTWLIQGIYSGTLANVLIFKGGTAIRKVYAPEWRLSEDLDFTVVKKVTPATVRKAFESVFSSLKRQSGLAFEFTQFHAKPYYVQARIQFLGPLDYKNTVKLDISFTEKLVEEPVTVEVEPEFEDVPGFAALAYTLNEIMIEKLRSIMQRGYARDYYDVWRLLKEREYDLALMRKLLVKKCELTDVAFEPELFFDEDRLSEAGRHWETALARLTKDLPPFEKVIGELRASLAQFAE